MTTIHYAYCFATLAFGTVAMFITNDTSLSFNGPSDDFFLYLVPFIAIGGTLVGHFIFNTNLKEVQQKPSLQEKLSGYQSARLIRLALIEGPSLFAIYQVKTFQCGLLNECENMISNHSILFP